MEGMRRNKGYKASIIDMRLIYTKFYGLYGDCPQVVVCDDLHEPMDAEIHEMDNGNVNIYIKNDDLDKMCKCLGNALERRCVAMFPAAPIEYHNLSDEEVTTWTKLAIRIANFLDIPLPQIIFSEAMSRDGLSTSLPSNGMIWMRDIKIDDGVDTIEMMTELAHELRHVWQEKNHPEWFDNYIHPTTGDDDDPYYTQISEVDAELFGRLLAEDVFNCDLISILRDDIKVVVEDHLERIELGDMSDIIEDIINLLKPYFKD